MCWTPLYVNKLDVNCIRHDPSYKQQTTGGKDNDICDKSAIISINISINVI
jgi:hypothetical protein